MTKTLWRQIGIAAVYLAVITVIASFAYSGLRGDRGIGALAEARAETAALERRLALLSEDRARLANKVARLRPDNLDLDLLDERARTVLGLARPDEIVIGPVTP